MYELRFKKHRTIPQKTCKTKKIINDTTLFKSPSPSLPTSLGKFRNV